MSKARTLVLGLSLLAMALLLFASLAGIFADDGGRPYRFTSLRAEEVEIYGGQGLYRHDNVYKAVEFRGFDLTSLVIVVPLFALGIYLYRQGRVRGQLLLAALFTYLAYIYALGVMGNAFNAMFLVWTALFSVGIFGLLLILTGMDVASVPSHLDRRFPRKGLAIYLVILGLILLTQYLGEVVSAYTSGSPPASLDHYTTLELAALELGIMIPLHLAGGVLLWRRHTAGYVLGAVLAFAAAMTFIALAIAMLMLRFSYGHESLFDQGLTIALAVVASSISLLVFLRVKD